MAEMKQTIPMPESYSKLMFVTQAHVGAIQTSKSMRQYVFGECRNKVKVFDMNKTWEKFILAARAIAGMQSSESIIAITSKTFGSKAVLRFAESIMCRSYTGRFIPGSFTNKNIKNSCEPSMIVVSDPAFDRQAVLEAATVNCPTIAFCNADADLSYVDIAIPVNNRSPKAIGACFFILSRLVNYMRHGTPLESDMKDVELFFYRDAKEIEKLCEEQSADKKTIEYADPAASQQEGNFGRTPIPAESNGGWDD